MTKKKVKTKAIDVRDGRLYITRIVVKDGLESERTISCGYSGSLEDAISKPSQYSVSDVDRVVNADYAGSKIVTVHE